MQKLILEMLESVQYLIDFPKHMFHYRSVGNHDSFTYVTILIGSPHMFMPKVNSKNVSKNISIFIINFRLKKMEE